MLFSVALLFSLALISALLPESFRKFRGWILSFSLGSLFLYFLSRVPMVSNQQVSVESFDWMPGLGISFAFYLDGLSILFALLVLGIGTFIFIYANDYMKSYAHTRRFYFFMLFFTASMLGLVFSSNLLVLFLFWELTSVSSFFLIGFFHHKAEARKAAIQSFLITGIGGLSLLAGIILLRQVTGSFDLLEIVLKKETILHSQHYLTILILFLGGIFTKSAQFPFHFWLPGAMQAPSPVSAFLHSATMVKAGIFLLFRISPFLGGTPYWNGIVTFFGALTMFVGAYMAITKSDLKAILAHTTISALGVLTMLIGIDTKLSIKAAILFLVIHSLYKATLFMIAGVIDKKTGTREISKLGGLFKRMPVAVSAALIALLSMSGLPPMLGFIGKELIYEANVQAGDVGTVVLILGILSNVFMVWISGMLAYRAFFGPSRKELKKPMEPSLAILAGPIVFSVLSLLLGLFPGKFGELIVEPALIASRAEILDIKLKLWHGFNEVFFLSLATIVSGVVLFFLSEKLIPVLRKINAAFFDYDFSGTFFKMIDGLLNFSRQKTSVIQHGYHRFYLMIIFVVAGLLILFQLISIKGWAIPPHTGAIPFYLVITAVLIAASAIFVTITGSRMAAVVLLGVTGYGIALIYLFYGGIDLAITQLLIETLTVILFVLVIRRLPKFKTLSTLPSRIRDLLIALLIGVVMTGLTLKAGILNFREPISEFFIERSLPEGFGKNIVNVILVDFRALDTLGEITVLTVAAVGVWVLLKFKVKA